MEAADLPGVGGPALHPDLQWDGPSWGVTATVSQESGLLGSWGDEGAWGEDILCYHCPIPGGEFHIPSQHGEHIWAGFPE